MYTYKLRKWAPFEKTVVFNDPIFIQSSVNPYIYILVSTNDTNRVTIVTRCHITQIDRSAIKYPAHNRYNTHGHILHYSFTDTGNLIELRKSVQTHTTHTRTHTGKKKLYKLKDIDIDCNVWTCAAKFLKIKPRTWYWSICHFGAEIWRNLVPLEETISL